MKNRAKNFKVKSANFVPFKSIFILKATSKNVIPAQAGIHKSLT
jgi:hypothetical protein